MDTTVDFLADIGLISEEEKNERERYRAEIPDERNFARQAAVACIKPKVTYSLIPLWKSLQIIHTYRTYRAYIDNGQCLMWVVVEYMYFGSDKSAYIQGVGTGLELVAIPSERNLMRRFRPLLYAWIADQVGGALSAGENLRIKADKHRLNPNTPLADVILPQSGKRRVFVGTSPPEV